MGFMGFGDILNNIARAAQAVFDSGVVVYTYAARSSTSGFVRYPIEALEKDTTFEKYDAAGVFVRITGKTFIINNDILDRINAGREKYDRPRENDYIIRQFVRGGVVIEQWYKISGDFPIEQPNPAITLINTTLDHEETKTLQGPPGENFVPVFADNAGEIPEKGYPWNVLFQMDTGDIYAWEEEKWVWKGNITGPAGISFIPLSVPDENSIPDTGNNGEVLFVQKTGNVYKWNGKEFEFLLNIKGPGGGEELDLESLKQEIIQAVVDKVLDEIEIPPLDIIGEETGTVLIVGKNDKIGFPTVPLYEWNEGTSGGSTAPSSTISLPSGLAVVSTPDSFPSSMSAIGYAIPMGYKPTFDNFRIRLRYNSFGTGNSPAFRFMIIDATRFHELYINGYGLTASPGPNGVFKFPFSSWIDSTGAASTSLSERIVKTWNDPSTKLPAPATIRDEGWCLYDELHTFEGFGFPSLSPTTGEEFTVALKNNQVIKSNNQLVLWFHSYRNAPDNDTNAPPSIAIQSYLLDSSVTSFTQGNAGSVGSGLNRPSLRRFTAPSGVHMFGGSMATNMDLLYNSGSVNPPLKSPVIQYPVIPGLATETNVAQRVVDMTVWNSKAESGTPAGYDYSDTGLSDLASKMLPHLIEVFP